VSKKKKRREKTIHVFDLQRLIDQYNGTVFSETKESNANEVLLKTVNRFKPLESLPPE
jgi:hypothetical protein